MVIYQEPPLAVLVAICWQSEMNGEPLLDSSVNKESPQSLTEDQSFVKIASVELAGLVGAAWTLAMVAAMMKAMLLETENFILT